MRQPLIAGNWKMHGTKSSAKQLLQSIVEKTNNNTRVEWVVIPPFVHLSECARLLTNSPVRLGAQTVSEFSDGAYTGEISADMLVDLGCQYVITGHSERRSLYGETNEVVAKKCAAAFQAGLIPIVCVGETLAERERGLTLKVVHEQLEVVLVLKDNCAGFSKIVIAYEPIWAIGTGRSATQEQAQAVHQAIRQQLSAADGELGKCVRILYGGSVKSDNAKALFSMPDIDGALIGGASLHADQFIKIGELCNNSF